MGHCQTPYSPRLLLASDCLAEGAMNIAHAEQDHLFFPSAPY